ncbi:MAG TPA: DUF2786 domain-containing protein [Acidimicrobiales bacterium]|nr:DUF2786 domain-containing protein [Acidimicrobiales bacterium]
MTSATGAISFDQVKAGLADKVRKLLAQAEDPGATPEEAQSFTAKAQQLMTKYAIDWALITDADRMEKVTQGGWRIEGPYAAHKVTLVNAIARANDCRAVYTDLAGGAKFMDVVGYPDDVDWVETLFRSLELQLTLALAAAMRVKPDRVHGRTYAVGFIQGYVHEVAERLRRARRDAVAAADAERARQAAASERLNGAGDGGSAPSSVALVLVAKAAQVDDEYRVRFPGARAVHRYTRLSNWSGWDPGRAAGARANLARGSVGSRRSLSA